MIGVRLDSGDRTALSIETRRMLDEAGFVGTVIDKTPSDLTGAIDATGPKISSRPIAIAGDTSSNTVGPTKKPFGRSATAVCRPSTRSLAPSATPFPM